MTEVSAVADLGSNSFRLVVFTAGDGWWKRTDEIDEAVRIGEGLAATGELGEPGMARAQATMEVFAHFCAASGIGVDAIDAVATSAIRDASNSPAFLERAQKASGLRVRVLSGEAEARYGYLAAVNSTTLADGVVLDLGGGSMQLTRVEGRRSVEARSWPLGAVRMTERFLTSDPAKRKQIKALRAHVAEQLAGAPWIAGGGRAAGIGGTVRNLAAAAQLAAGLPSYGIQGFRLTREALGALIERLAGMTAAERGKVAGIKAERGDVRVASVRNLAAQYHSDFAHTNHVAGLALEMWDALAAQGVHGGDREERELLWASAMLHDIGVAVDYDDHHKHSRYLILNAGLPGYSPRESALIGQAARYHRKGTPGLGEFAPLAHPGDAQMLDRISAMVRLAEELERSRDQA